MPKLTKNDQYKCPFCPDEVMLEAVDVFGIVFTCRRCGYQLGKEEDYGKDLNDQK